MSTSPNNVKPVNVVMDWPGIYASLQNVVQSTESQSIPSNTANGLRALRTVHMGGGLRNGKTSWAVSKLSEDGHIIVARDKLSRNSTERMYYLVNPRRVINITIPAEHPNPHEAVEELIASLHKNARRKVFTVMDLLEIVKEAPEKLSHVTHVIIDDATYNTRTNEVYKVFADLKMFDTTFVALS